MSLEEVPATKISKGSVVLIFLLYWFLTIIVEIINLLPQMIKAFTEALNQSAELDAADFAQIMIRNVSYSWYQVVLNILVISLIVYLLKRQHVHLFKRPGFDYSHWLMTVSLAVASVALNSAVEWVLVSTQPQFTTQNQMLLELILNNSSIIVMFIAIVLVAPVVEEVIFRGIFIGALFKEKPWLGLIISSVLFALLHSPSDVPSFIVYVVPGLTLGLIYMKTDWIGASILAHMLNNLLAFLTM